MQDRSQHWLIIMTRHRNLVGIRFSQQFVYKLLQHHLLWWHFISNDLIQMHYKGITLYYHLEILPSNILSVCLHFANYVIQQCDINWLHPPTPTTNGFRLDCIAIFSLLHTVDAHITKRIVFVFVFLWFSLSGFCHLNVLVHGHLIGIRSSPDIYKPFVEHFAV